MVARRPNAGLHGRRFSPNRWDLWTFSRPSKKAELFAVETVTKCWPRSRRMDGGSRTRAPVPMIGLQVQPFPATGVVHQITEAGEVAPVWTAAGDELFFWTAVNAGQSSQIKGLEIATAGVSQSKRADPADPRGSHELRLSRLRRHARRRALRHDLPRRRGSPTGCPYRPDHFFNRFES